MGSAMLFRDIGSVKERVSRSLESLVKERNVELVIDDIEVSHIADAALEDPIRSFEEIYRLGPIAEEIIKPNPDFGKHIWAFRDNPTTLLPLVSNAAIIARKSLANSGVLCEDFLERYPLQVIGRNSYAASSHIANILRKDKGLARLLDEMLCISPEDLKIKLDEKMRYLMIFSRRFPEYTRILRNAGIKLVNDPLQDIKEGRYVIGIDLEKRRKEKEKEEDELIRELSLPSRESFRKLISAVSGYEERMSYETEAAVSEFDRKGMDIDIIVGYKIKTDGEGIPKDIFDASLAIKKAVFLINTFYHDNGISSGLPKKEGSLLFTRELMDRLISQVDADVDRMYRDVISQYSSFFYHLANEKRIRKKPMLFQELCNQAMEYESRVDHPVMVLPSEEFKSFSYDSSDGKDISDLLKYAALRLIGGMQTAIYYTPNVEKEHMDPNIESMIEESLEGLRERSEILMHIRDFFDESENDYLIAHGISRIDETLKEDRFCKMMKEDFYRASRGISQKMLILQSELMGIPLRKNKAYRLYSTGDNTMLYFQIAGLIENELTDQTNFNHVPLGKIAFTRDIHKRVDDLLIIDKTKGKEKYTEEELIEYLSEYIGEDSVFRDLISRSHDPVSYLKEKLSVFRSIPEALAENLESALKKKLLGTLRPRQAGPDPENVCISGCENPNNHLDACISVFNRKSPFKLEDVDYSEIDPEGKDKNLAMCRSAISVLSLRGENPKEIYSRFIHAGEDHHLDTVKRMFPKDSIYFGPISGVAVPFELSKGGNIRHRGSVLFGAGPSDVQIYTGQADDLEARISGLKTIFHEFTHASHTGFRHNWRRLMALYSEILIDFMLKRYDSGTEEKVPFFSSNYIRINKEIIEKDMQDRLSYKDIVLSIIDDFSKVALGVGKKADDLRKDGFFEGGVIIPYRIGEGFYKVSGFDVSDIKIENSDISMLVGKVISAIKKDDIGRIRKLKDRLKDYAEGSNTIEETSAEVMSCLCLQDMFQRLKIISPEMSESYDRLSRQVEDEFSAISRITIESEDIISWGRKKPLEMERALNERGWTYRRVLDYWEDIVPLAERLDGLGVSRLSCYSELYDFAYLRRSIKGDEKDFYLPINEARNFINSRYRKYIPMALDQIRILGDSGWSMILGSEYPKDAFIQMKDIPIIGK